MQTKNEEELLKTLQRIKKTLKPSITKETVITSDYDRLYK